MEHKSTFTYAVSRPYPFRWFTPVAVVGGIIFIALFTFMNYASSSYELIVQISTNPNATVSGGGWLHHWPSFLTTKVQPKCQPTGLPVNSQFFTNQTALKYTLTSVWQQDEPDGDQILSPSLLYYNNVLQNCSVTAVDVDLEALSRSGKQFAYSEWGAIVRSYLTCQIMNPTGLVLFNLTQTYEYIPDTISLGYIYQFLGTEFLSRNQTARASLWWGESLMSTYWGSSTWQMQQVRENQTRNNDPGVSKGTVAFTRNESVSDITDLNFFGIDYRFLVDRGGGVFDVVCCPPINQPLTAEVLTDANVFPSAWVTLDTLAKAAYSTVLTDMGQTAAKPNILTDSTLLAHFTSNFSHIDMANFKPGPANDSFSVLKETTGPLGTTPSVIATTYICQVPRLKSAASLIVAILVADLVLLQAVWQLYKLAAEAFVVMKKPSANYCEGCLRFHSSDSHDSPGASLLARSNVSSEYHALVDGTGFSSREDDMRQPPSNAA